MGGRISGTPAQIARPLDDPSLLTVDDARTRRKNTPGDQSMRRTIQDLVASVDPNVKMEAEVEDVRGFFLYFRVMNYSLLYSYSYQLQTNSSIQLQISPVDWQNTVVRILSRSKICSCTLVCLSVCYSSLI